MRRAALFVGASVGVPVGTIFVWARLVMRRGRLRTSEGFAEAELRESGEA